MSDVADVLRRHRPKLSPVAQAVLGGRGHPDPGSEWGDLAPPVEPPDEALPPEPDDPYADVPPPEEPQGTDGDHSQERGQSRRPDPEPRRVDLTAYLDGTYVAPQPELGAHRDDGRQLLYPGHWHTCMGTTGAGKTWLALWHVAAELDNGHTVVYLHFEEGTPAGTVARLLALGVDREVIRDRFIWLDCDRLWQPGEFAAEFAAFHDATLAVLDGINAACTRHGHNPSEPVSLGWYRRTLVTPATAAGAAVLSLGHPVKARDRQDERHGFGYTGWLDEVDGVGFRLLPGKAPIRRGMDGSAHLYSVKDRNGGVEQHGVADRREGWVYLGTLAVNPLGVNDEYVDARLVAPDTSDATSDTESDDDNRHGLAQHVLDVLNAQPERSVGSERALFAAMRAAGHKARDTDIRKAVDDLVYAKRVETVKGRGTAKGYRSLTASQDQEASAA